MIKSSLSLITARPEPRRCSFQRRTTYAPGALLESCSQYAQLPRYKRRALRSTPDPSPSIVPSIVYTDRYCEQGVVCSGLYLRGHGPGGRLLQF
jgi:hypothetical protein